MISLTTSEYALLPSRAWREFRGGGPTPTRIVRIGRDRHPLGRKTAVWRLMGAGPSGEPIIAKWARTDIAEAERYVYTTVLPEMPISSLAFLGAIETSGEDRTWLFLEDAGDAVPSGEEYVRRRTRLLAALHTASHDSDAVRCLPPAGPERYLEHLRSAREQVADGRRNPAFEASHLTDLDRVLEFLDEAADRWSSSTQAVNALPSTLVHGDLSPKNLRFPRDDSRKDLVAFDWETSGYGSPAADLAEGEGVDLDLYLDLIAPVWSHLTRKELREASRVGAFFRRIAGMDWAATRLRFPHPDRGRRRLLGYLDEFSRA